MKEYLSLIIFFSPKSNPPVSNLPDKIAVCRIFAVTSGYIIIQGINFFDFNFLTVFFRFLLILFPKNNCLKNNSKYFTTFFFMPWPAIFFHCKKVQNHWCQYHSTLPYSKIGRANPPPPAAEIPKINQKNFDPPK